MDVSQHAAAALFRGAKRRRSFMKWPATKRDMAKPSRAFWRDTSNNLKSSVNQGFFEGVAEMLLLLLLFLQVYKKGTPI